MVQAESYALAHCPKQTRAAQMISQFWSEDEGAGSVNHSMKGVYKMSAMEALGQGETSNLKCLSMRFGPYKSHLNSLVRRGPQQDLQ